MTVTALPSADYTHGRRDGGPASKRVAGRLMFSRYSTPTQGAWLKHWQMLDGDATAVSLYA